MFLIFGIVIFMGFWWALASWYFEYMAKKLTGKRKKKKTKKEEKELDNIVKDEHNKKNDNVIYIRDYVIKKRNSIGH